MNRVQFKIMALEKRPPVITIMGHVDHGKTTLLDFIRKSKVVEGEAGGITQHIGAYSIDFKGQQLTFIDTPGHAAFNKMRARGASLTDIVVLVVAANDGVKPQTIESIRHIKQSNVPVIVAINKTDLPDVRLDEVKSQLVEHDISVTGFGGDVEAVEVSALKGKGVDKLLETIAVTADLLELKADAAAPLEAVVIESSIDAHRGPVAAVIVKQGTLKIRQDLKVDDIAGRVKQILGDAGQSLDQVTPGLPGEIMGLQAVPAVGSMVKDASAEYEEEELEETRLRSDELLRSEEEEKPVVADKETTSDVVDEAGADNEEKTESGDETGLDELDFSVFDQMLEDKPKLKLIIKADVEGTLEAIVQNLDEESTQLLSFGVGQVTEKDLEMAETSGATIIGFQVKVSGRIKKLAKQAGVKLKTYEIIYKLIEDLQQAQLKLLEPTIDEEVLGEAEILQIFEMRGDRIAGVRVKTGEMKKSNLFHLKRGDEITANPVIKSMMHGKEEVDTIKTKNEGGLTFKNKKLDFEVGDIVVAYKIADE